MSPWETVFGLLHGQAGTHKDQGRCHPEEERFHLSYCVSFRGGGPALGLVKMLKGRRGGERETEWEGLSDPKIPGEGENKGGEQRMQSVVGFLNRTVGAGMG